MLPLPFLSNEFLAQLVQELDDEMVTAIILHGSYARGDAITPFSDIDLVRIVQETSMRVEQKQFQYRDDSLISISTRPLSIYRERFSQPEKAIFAVPGVREARILLDKDGAFRALRREALLWKWEPLQPAANRYASQQMVEQTEIALKVLRGLMLHDGVALADMIMDLFAAVTEAIAVQQGVLVQSGNTYFHQVQASVGKNSLWTQLHLQTAGITMTTSSCPPIEARGVTALRLYQETSRLLQPYMDSEHYEVIEKVMNTVERTLANEYVL